MIYLSLDHQLRKLLIQLKRYSEPGRVSTVAQSILPFLYIVKLAALSKLITLQKLN